MTLKERHQKEERKNTSKRKRKGNDVEKRSFSNRINV